MPPAEKETTPKEVTPTPSNAQATLTVLQDVDFEKALSHLEDVERHVMTFAGREKYNPYIWISKNLYPLRIEYNAGVRSNELRNKMLNLKKEEPTAPKIQVSEKEIKG